MCQLCHPLLRASPVIYSKCIKGGPGSVPPRAHYRFCMCAASVERSSRAPFSPLRSSRPNCLRHLRKRCLGHRRGWRSVATKVFSSSVAISTAFFSPSFRPEPTTSCLPCHFAPSFDRALVACMCQLPRMLFISPHCSRLPEARFLTVSRPHTPNSY
jgi:hypothetical protein